MRAAPSLFYRLADVLPTTNDYPLAEFNDYLRTYPEHAADVARTLGYFDPLAAARRAACPSKSVTTSSSPPCTQR